MLNMQLKSRQLFEVREPPGYSGSIVFMFQLRIFFSSRLHNKMSGLFDFPMISTTHLANYWKTSYCMKQTIRTADTNEWLNTVYVKNVNIDPIEQKPKSLPEDFVKKCQSALVNKEDIPIFVFPSSVRNPFSCHVYVTFSDTDHFLHLSHMTCMQYCLDCGRSAAVAGHFSAFKRDLCYYPIIRLEGLFLGQSTYGDRLTIQTWEDEHAEDTLHFIVTKDSHQIFKATYQFQINNESRL